MSSTNGFALGSKREVFSVLDSVHDVATTFEFLVWEGARLGLTETAKTHSSWLLPLQNIFNQFIRTIGIHFGTMHAISKVQEWMPFWNSHGTDHCAVYEVPEPSSHRVLYQRFQPAQAKPMSDRKKYFQQLEFLVVETTWKRPAKVIAKLQSPNSFVWLKIF